MVSVLSLELHSLTHTLGATRRDEGYSKGSEVYRAESEREDEIMGEAGRKC